MPAYSKKFVLSTQVSMLARAAVTAGRSLWPAFSRCPLGQESWSCAILSEGRAVGIFRFFQQVLRTLIGQGQHLIHQRSDLSGTVTNGRSNLLLLIGSK